MSFNTEIKKELSGLYSSKSCCEKAALATYFAILSEEKKTGIYIKTENLNLARRINILSKKILDIEPETILRQTKKKGTMIITLKITDGASIEKLKKQLKLFHSGANTFFSRIDPEFTLSECCKCSSIKAAFLTCGLISSPKKSYHLEFVTHKKQVCEDIISTLIELRFEPKISTRKSNYVIYMKNNEEIYRFLSLLNLKRSMAKFYEIKSEKDLKNTINRQMNCENANENKRINSSVIQIQAIKLLKKNSIFETLPVDLQKTAELRLKNPNASLSELCEIAEFPITKSGLNHRLKKIISIAQIKTR